MYLVSLYFDKKKIKKGEKLLVEKSWFIFNWNKYIYLLILFIVVIIKVDY